MPETTQSDLVEKLRACANGVGSLKDHQGDFGLCDTAADLITQQAAEIERLRKRLELRDPDWPEEADGIACRNDTIALLDERVARQSAEITRLRARCEAMAKAVKTFTNNYLLDERESPEICWDADHHQAVVALFDVLEDYHSEGAI